MIDKWFPLENTCGQGQLRVRMALGMLKDKMAAIQDYKKIIQLLVIHDLENGKMEPFTWNGKFARNNWTDYIQRQIGWTWSLKPQQILLSQWVAYNRIHLEFALSTKLFPSFLTQILMSMENPIQSQLEVCFVPNKSG